MDFFAANQHYKKDVGHLEPFQPVRAGNVLSNIAVSLYLFFKVRNPGYTFMLTKHLS